MDDQVCVLLVDDEPDVAELTSTWLEQHEGIETLVALSATDALDRLDGVDCVVSDYNMPGLNGLGLLSAIRKVDADLPFILFTGRGSEEIASKAIAEGVTDYLQKGVGREQYEVLANRVLNAVNRYRAEQELERAEERYRRLVEQNLTGIYIIQDDYFQYGNPRMAELLECDQEALKSGELHQEQFVVERDRPRVNENLRQRESGAVESLQFQFTLRRQSGDLVEVEVHGGHIEYEGEPAVMGTIVEIPSSQQFDRAVSELDRAIRRLARADSVDDIAAIALDAATTVFGLEAVGLSLDGGATWVRTTDAFDELFVPETAERQRLEDLMHETVDDEAVDDQCLGSDETLSASLKRGLIVPLNRGGVLVVATSEPLSFETVTQELVHVLAAHVNGALDKTEWATRLEQLHEATRLLMAAETEFAVAEVMTETTRNVIGRELNALLVPNGEGMLVPMSATSETEALIGDIPPLPIDGSIAGAVYREGASRVLGDVRTDPAVSNPSTVMRSELHVPLGTHGVFLVGSTRVDDFTESDISLARILASNVESALDRAQREETLRRRETELSRQNERLDQFASVVSHDLQTPLNVAQGRLDLAREAYDVDEDDEHFAAIERAHNRIASLTDSLLSLARQGQAIGEKTAVDLEPVVRTVWGTTGGESLTVADELGVIEADSDRLYELVENLLRNTVEHGSKTVTVTVGRLEAGGFYVSDDGPGVDPEDREQVFEHGYTTNRSGTGFGLAIVQTVAEAHGWTVSVTESEAGGARFEIETGTAE